ncbi:purine-binding chemotaxis protein CheW [Rhodopseudomonas rhenobacensis]|uniref:Purine-binding chemotaxis protein CheW n=1 Tax=Rhodopseudomonas rhenobacensis TaxID=87461 RepID=A0A7W7Z180_9BRAD|nr:chemotaxis protein CheW [Rhodopseudomonas rhenobacensis]MBB5046036.1 purine-binding chemotaxis protein CheW [Rhodopseudomonas rhenobacensis]
MDQIVETRPRAEAESEQMQVVMLGIGDEVFALNTMLVREIIDPVPATRVAGARPYLPCVVNVRGNVIPLADLRSRFGMAKTAATADTRIVVLEIEIDRDPVLVGVVADKVHEVTQISRADAQPTPRVGMRWNPEFISFITKWRDEFVIVPNMERILS